MNQNVSVWGETYDWSQQGDEWSDAWGGVSHQWWNTLFPRIQGYVPARRILEIAPGYGRWTHFLRDLCDELVIVDIAESAITHCRTRFAGDPRISSYINDGTSLPMAADASIDFVFSFDSLVHAEADVMSAYIRELSRILAPDGVAFLHHSNVGSYPPASYDPDNIHWRATSVSAESIEQLADSSGLRCLSQETVAWGNETLLNDCFSVIARGESRWDRGNVRIENLDFSCVEIAKSKQLSLQYPASARDVRFTAMRPSAPSDDHASALALLDTGDAEGARATLHRHLRDAIDPEALNDLAVLTLECGDRQAALELLRALSRLYPEYAAASRNLAALSPGGDR